MAFNINQERLAQTLSTVYQKQFGKYNYYLAVEETNELSADARSATKLGVETSGKSRESTDTTTGMPLAHIELDDQPVPIYTREIGFHITPQDEAIARLDGNFNPIKLRMEGAQKIYLGDLHKFVMEGNSSFKGLINYDLLAANKARPLINFKTASTDDIFNAMIGIMGDVFDLSNGNRVCNTVLLPTAAFVSLGTRVFTANPGQTLLEAILRAGNALIGEHEGNGSTRPFRLVPTHSIKGKIRAYDRDPEAIQFEVPMELQYSQPYYDGHNQIHPGMFRHTPLIVNDSSGIVEVAITT